MSWIQVVEGDLNDAKAAPIILAIQTTVLAVGQGDPLPNLINSVCQEIIGMIGFSGKYPLDGASTTTIPANLKDMAVQRIYRMAKTRVGMVLTPAEQQDESVYNQRLAYIRDGRWPVDQPDIFATVNPSLPQGRVDFVKGFHRRFTRKQMRGFL